MRSVEFLLRARGVFLTTCCRSMLIPALSAGMASGPHVQDLSASPLQELEIATRNCQPSSHEEVTVEAMPAIHKSFSNQKLIQTIDLLLQHHVPQVLCGPICCTPAYTHTDATNSFCMSKCYLSFGYVHAPTYTYLYLLLHLHIHVQIQALMHMYKDMYICMRICACTYICMCTCSCICTYMYTYKYTHAYKVMYAQT